VAADDAQGRLPDAESARRAFLILAGGTLGASCLGLSWAEVARAAQAAARAPSSGAAFSFLTPAEAVEVDALAAQIIPTDATPGAREAGVVVFVDRALGSFYAREAAIFRSGLADFNARLQAWRPGANSFAALASSDQVAFLHTVEGTPFFGAMRTLTVLGMFALPAYGGNRDGAGWKLLGFENLHAFEPPFGYYDRDYPGFAAQPHDSP
jgi:gluconate 2-dehydrogenase gamma chain